MFRGEKVIRFFSHAGEASVLRAAQDALAGLGQVTVDRAGSIQVKAKTAFRSALTGSTMGGRLRRRHKEFEVRIAYECRPTRAAWVITAAGTVPLLLGWVTILASWSMRRTVEHAVRQALR